MIIAEIACRVVPQAPWPPAADHDRQVAGKLRDVCFEGVFTMAIGVLIALFAAVVVLVALGWWPGLIVGLAVFAMWYAIRRYRMHSRRAEGQGGGGSDSGTSDGSSAPTSGSSEHGAPFSGAGGAFGGAGASALWAAVFDSSGGLDSGGHGGDGGGADGGGGGNGGGGNGGH
jgi:uncharacterized membrane protein YgcG